MMFVLVCFLAVLTPALAQSKLVNTAQGPVVGYKTNNAEVFGFRGIPYATAPTGRDKFKAPLPGPTWTEPYEATVTNVMCPQYEGAIRNPWADIKEDCLVANVYTPVTNETNLPVIFFVHGGGFVTGTGHGDSPTEFVETYNIIAVTFNYRLGPHGFMCLGTENIPGNAGIKDQVAALRWVNQNIANFGGNPNDVTIAGCSAGGAAVDLLMISKTTKGLFNKVIGQSGANVASFAIQVDPFENAVYYAKNINYTGAEGDIQALEEFYRSISMDDLLSYSLESNRDHAIKMTPCLERNLGSETFMEESPVNILRSGEYDRHPMIYGYADMDGLLRIGLFESWRHEMNEDFTPFVPADLEFENAEEKRRVADEIKRFYFGDRLVNNETIVEFISFFSDAIFLYPMQHSAKLQVESGNNEIYLHVYSFTDENTPYIPNTNVKGANHCYQVMLIFDHFNRTVTPEYSEMRRKMRETWADFIKTGNPTPVGSSVPKWDPVRSDRAPCMNFGRTIQLEGTFAKERTEFWDSIYERYYRQPVPPPSSAPVSAFLSTFLGVVLLFVVQIVSSMR